MRFDGGRRASGPESAAPASKRLTMFNVCRTATGQFILGAAVIVLFSLFIFSNTDGNIGVHGDDVLFMAHMHPFSWDYFREVPGRGYLTPFYSLVFDLSGQSSQRAHIFWFCVWVASALLLYRILSKLLGTAAATVAGVCYLGYAGKHEIVTWLSAAAYLVITLVLFVSIWIAIAARLGPWTKALAITALTWAGTLLCEILIVAAPLYPLLFWLHHRLHGLRTPPRKLLPTFLPSIMFAGHVLTIYLNTPRDHQVIWMRGGAEGRLPRLAASLWHLFQLSFSESVGTRHCLFTGREFLTFWNYVPLTAWGITAGILAIAGVLILLIARVGTADSRQSTLTLLAAAGLYLVLFSPLVGFTTIDLAVPPRLLTLSGIGLALLAGVIASAALTSCGPVLKWTVIPLLLCAASIEGAAMNGILYQHQTSWEFDSRIQSQLLASGISPQLGDGIFVSLPEHPLWPIWKVGFPQFDGNHAQPLLLLDYGMLAGHNETPIDDRLRYYGHTRGHTDDDVARVQAGKRAYCFFVRDGDYRMAPTACN